MMKIRFKFCYYSLLQDKLLGYWPGIIYAFFAGALSDRYGRKYLVCLPVMGVLASTFFQIIHFTYISELPMEFFYMDNWYTYAGGFTVYYLGLYSYASDVSTGKTRAIRLAVFDGFEMGAGLLGTIASPYVFAYGGYYAVYITRASLLLISLIYFMLCIKSPCQLGINQEDEDSQHYTRDDILPVVSKMLHIHIILIYANLNLLNSYLVTF